MSATDLPGFDPTDPTTWHPMHGRVVGALQRVAGALHIPYGLSLVVPAEHIARGLFPTAEDDVARLRGLLAEVIPYAIAGADALDVHEPYGDATCTEHAVLCEGAPTMLARLRTGGDIATAASAR